jgi:hypothetical protein
VAIEKLEKGVYSLVSLGFTSATILTTAAIHAVRRACIP